tara:strand:- start:1396 stop:1845 length:450 start_codon:yes stop_codon:yes gene_type:complete
MYSLSSQPSERRGLALLEVMIAVAILTVAVVAITSAIVGGQQQSLESRTTIVASIAAESLLATLSQEPWESIDSWDGYSEEVGEIVDATGLPIGGDWDVLGRSVSVIETNLYVEPLLVFITGKTVSVSVFTNDGRELTSVNRFIPEPQS